MSSYKSIGECISVIDNRNSDGSITRLLGLSIDKCYIPSVANIIGTDLKKYKVLRKGQFACSLMQVSRDQKVPIAMYTDEVPAIISPAYIMFNVSVPNILLPEYLDLWFKRVEFDREATFYAIGGVRGSLDWEDFCNMKLPVPSISEQCRIVRVYHVISERIELLQKINRNLLLQVNTIFKRWFTNNPNLESFVHIPLSELCLVVTKGTTPTTLGKPFVTEGINFIKAESITGDHTIDQKKFAFIDEETNTLLKRSIICSGDIVFTIAGTLGRFALVDDSVIPANVNQAVAIIRVDKAKVFPEYIYSFFVGNWHNDYYTKRIQHAVQANLSLGTIKSLPIPVLPKTAMEEYLGLIRPVITMMKVNQREIRILESVHDSLLPKLMSGELDVSELDI